MDTGSTKQAGFISEITWVKETPLRLALYYLLCFASGGLLLLAVFYYPSLYTKLTTSQCEAKYSDFCIIVIDGIESVAKSEHITIGKSDKYILLVVRCVRYWAANSKGYKIEKIPDVPVNFVKFLTPQRHISENDASAERNFFMTMYGLNETSLPAANPLEILLRHALSPFYLFQYFAIILWFTEDYIVYSILILLITFGAIYSNTKESIHNLNSLRKLAGITGEVPSVPNTIDFNTSTFRTDRKVADSNLIPGDWFIVNTDLTIPCDAVLISGRVVVDESMLTGESVPVTKTPIEPTSVVGPIFTMGVKDGQLAQSDIESNESQVVTAVSTESQCNVEQMAVKRSGNVLFAGTKVRACHGGHCIAVVYRTAFRSAKGQLIASLLNPKEGLEMFIADALKLVFCMLLLTTFLYIITAVEMARLGATQGQITFRYFDAITIAVPPALTACLTVSTAISIDRLREAFIFVSDTVRVNLAGTVTSACFDKTGTLTEDKLHFNGACIVQTASSSGNTLKEINSNQLSSYILCQELMASCHNLAVLEGHDPAGDPLEVEQFRASNWKVTMEHTTKDSKMVLSPPTSNDRYEVVRHFEFTPERLRAATLLKKPDNQLVYLLKGSPEMIASLCVPSSVPVDLKNTLTGLAKRGLRVIAMAYRKCPENASTISVYTQDQIESLGNIQFYGLLFFSSNLKEATIDTISSLQLARVDTKMITGDHIHTAIAVAKECGILTKPSIDNNNGDNKNKVIIVDENESSEKEILMYDAENDCAMNVALEDLLDYMAMLSSSSFNVSVDSPKCSSKLQPFSSKSDSKLSTLWEVLGDKIEIAVTGKGLQAVRKLSNTWTFSSLIRYAKVFARTKPADKKTVVVELLNSTIKDERVLKLLKEYGRYRVSVGFWETTLDCLLMKAAADAELTSVLFCGDGANDMSALRAASVGVSLCDAETSVAAPITSKLQSPGSCINVLVEGRSSLITAYVLVMFNILYGLIQLFFTVLLYGFGLIIGNYMYLIQDLFYTLFLGLAISMTAPSDVLSIEIPPKRFLHPYLVSKLIAQMIVFIVFQIIALAALQAQSFYNEYTTDDPFTSTYSYEATVINNMALCQLMIASVVATIGLPFRKSWYTNKYHLIMLFFQFVWLCYQIFGNDKTFYRDFLELRPMPMYFGFELLALMLCNVVVSAGCAYCTESVRVRTLQSTQ